MTDRQQPGAGAARRARQIGGTSRPRPTPHGRTAEADVDDQADGPVEVEAPLTAPVDLAKPGSAAIDTGDTGDTHNAKDTEDTADAKATEVVGADTSGAPGRPRPRAAVAALLVVTVLLLAWGVLVLVVVVGHRCLGPLQACTQRGQTATDRAVAAAKTDVGLLTSYDYRTIDADAAKTSAVLTGEFKTQYDKSIQDVVKPQLPTTQTVSAGQVSTAGVESANRAGTEVVVVVYGQQAVTNQVQTTPRIDPFQLRVTMKLVDDRWLIGAVVQLGSQS